MTTPKITPRASPEGVEEIAQIERCLDGGTEISARKIGPEDIQGRILPGEAWGRLELPKRVILGLGMLGVEGLSAKGMPGTLCEVARATEEEKTEVPHILRGLISQGYIDREREGTRITSFRLSQLGIEKAFDLIENVQNQNTQHTNRQRAHHSPSPGLALG